VVPPGDADALAHAVLAYLAQPPAQVRAMVTAARQKVEEAFTVDRIARQQGELYRSLLSRP
jgi:glycosyltransferase involved in cell wall biosynthesis